MSNKPEDIARSKEIDRLTEELEQCRIELQSVKDELYDAKGGIH